MKWKTDFFGFKHSPPGLSGWCRIKNHTNVMQLWWGVVLHNYKTIFNIFGVSQKKELTANLAITDFDHFENKWVFQNPFLNEI